MGLVTVAATVVWLGISAQTTPPLAPVQRAMKDLNYAQAKEELGKVLASGATLSRAEVIEFYETTGIVTATLGDAAAAKDAFFKFALLEPAAKLKGRPSPKVSTPFFEAKAAAAEAGALGLSSEAVGPAAQRALRVKIVGRAEAFAASLSAESAPATGASVTKAFPLAPIVDVPCPTAPCQVTLRLLTPQGWELLRAGPVAVPALGDIPASPPNASTSPSPPTPAASQPPVSVAARAAEPKLRPLAYGLGVSGVVALGAGLVLGLVSNGERQRFANAARAPDGALEGLTRQQALDLEGTVRGTATGANVAFIAGGVLLAAGVVVWVLGLPPPVVARAGSGAALSWSFP